MKVAFTPPRGTLFVFALLPVVVITGCRSTNENMATAALPASNYQSPLQASPTNDSSIFANQDVSEPLPAPEKKKTMPFALRTGETLASYKVQKGDNLGKIAKLYGTSVSRIKSANGLSDDIIYAGKSYKVPTKRSESEIAAAASSSSSNASSSKITTSLPIKTTAPTPPAFTRSAPPSYNRPSSPTVISTSPSRPGSSGSYSSSTAGSYTPPKPRSFSPPPSSERPTFAPRSFDYDGPAISSPPVTIPTEEASGSGAAFPTPTFGSGTSF